MSDGNKRDGRKNNKPPAKHQFKPGQSGNPNGRPKKRKSTFINEIKDIFGEERQITINGKVKARNIRQIILEQMAQQAAKGDPKMIKLCIPFLKIMDDAPEFEILPEDKEIMDKFMNRFKDDGGFNDGND